MWGNEMKKAILFVSTIVISHFLIASVFAQSLFVTESSLTESDVIWQKRVGYDVLFITEKAEFFNDVRYTLLDDDVETGTFFWISNRFGHAINPTTVSPGAGSRVLWISDHLALIRAKRFTLQNLSKELTWRKATFRATTQAPRTLRKKPASTNSFFIQSVLDSVNLNRLYELEEHLTGEKPYWNGSGFDSIMTRYSYSGEIYKAQDYVSARLQEFGYNPVLQPFSFGSFYDIEFADDEPNRGWLTADDEIFGTTDGGVTWASQYQGSSGYSIWSVFVLDQNSAFAVGEGGSILTTTDGGTSWQFQTSPTNAFLFGVAFRNANLGWICGDGGRILKTTNGGTNWVEKPTPTSQRLYEIVFSDDNNGWAVGRNGTIVHTTDGGENWAFQSSGTTSRLYGLHFIDADKGFAVGWDARVLYTLNAGANWMSVSVPIAENFYDVEFAGADSGMIVGWSGACMTTTDGGSTWNSGASMMGKDIYACTFVGSNTVWGTGSGEVARTTDFGTSWISELGGISGNTINNVIATKTGTVYPDQYYILCAHYDATSNIPYTRAPGADDNGSGTSAVLEGARVLFPYNFDYSVRFILFPGEEQGLHGSAAYANAAVNAGEQILGVINLDMIGYDGNGDGQVEIHAGNLGSSQAIGTEIIANLGDWSMNLTYQYHTSTSSSASDHSSFWAVGYPAVMMIEDFADFTPFYHTTNDLLSTLRLSYFHENSKLAIGSLAQLAAGDSATSVHAGNPVPKAFRLHHAYPNPFNPRTTLKYEIPENSRVRLVVYNVLGVEVSTLVDRVAGAGTYETFWDGTNGRGNRVATGMYIVKLEAGTRTQSRKILLLK